MNVLKCIVHALLFIEHSVLIFQLILQDAAEVTPFLYLLSKSCDSI